MKTLAAMSERMSPTISARCDEVGNSRMTECTTNSGAAKKYGRDSPLLRPTAPLQLSSTNQSSTSIIATPTVPIPRPMPSTSLAAGAMVTAAASTAGHARASPMPLLPNELLIEHVMPYLDRRTFDNFMCVNTETYRLTRMVRMGHTVSAMPQQRVSNGRITSTSTNTSATTQAVAEPKPPLAPPPWPQTQLDISSGIAAIAFNAAADMLALGCKDGSVRLVSVHWGKIMRWNGHASKVTSLQFSSDSRFLASSSKDGTVLIWDMQQCRSQHQQQRQRRCKTQSRRQQTDSTSVHASCNNVDNANNTKGFKRKDENHGNSEMRPIVIPNAGTSISFHPSGTILASAGLDGGLQLWNVPNGKRVGVMEHTDDVASIAFSPCGRRLASATWKGCIQLWELSWRCQSQLHHRYRHHLRQQQGSLCQRPVLTPSTCLGMALPSTQVQFSSDGRYLDCLKGFRVRRWSIQDKTTDTQCKIMCGRRMNMRVCSVAMSPDSKHIAYGESNGATHVSTMANSICDATIQHTMQAGQDRCVFAFTPNGRTLAAGGADGRLSLWEI